MRMRVLFRARHIQRSTRRAIYWSAICFFALIGLCSWLFELGNPGVAVLVVVGILIATMGLMYEIIAHRIVRQTNEIAVAIELVAIALIAVVSLVMLLIP
jgi:hypothetical protein